MSAWRRIEDRLRAWFPAHAPLAWIETVPGEGKSDQETLRATRGALLAYLEARLGHQIDYFRQVDTKVHVRVLVCVGLVVLVVPLLPVMPKLWIEVYQEGCKCELATVAGVLVTVVGGCLALFVASLGRTLWLALAAIDVAVAFPSMVRSQFEAVAAAEIVNAANVLGELAANCAKAVEANARVIVERDTKGDALIWWSRVTLVCSMMLLGLLASSATVIVVARNLESCMAAEKPQGGASTTTPTSSPSGGSNSGGTHATDQGTSLQGPPQVVGFGRGNTDQAGAAGAPTVAGEPTSAYFGKAHEGQGGPLPPNVAGETTIGHFGEAEQPPPTPPPLKD